MLQAQSLEEVHLQLVGKAEFYEKYEYLAVVWKEVCNLRKRNNRIACAVELTIFIRFA
jgi:hypothetical protein